MGAFIVNYHLQTERVDDLKSALPQIVRGAAWISGASNGWVSLYEETSSSQNNVIIERIGLELSRQADCPVIAFQIHDSDVMSYWLYDRGEAVDEFNSCPDYFGELADDIGESQAREYRERTTGQPDKLLGLCPTGTSIEELQSLIQQNDMSFPFAEERLHRLARLLDIPAERVVVDYHSIGEDLPPSHLQLEAVSATRTHADESISLRFPQTDNVGDEFDEDQVADVMAQMLDNIEEQLGDDKQMELVQAISQRQESLVEELLAGGADPNEPAPMIQMSPLFAAVSTGWPEMVHRLLELGADVNGQGTAMLSPLLMAVISRDVETVRLLVDAGADVQETDMQNHTVLHFAAQSGAPELVELFLSLGVDPRAVNQMGETAMDRAVQIQQMLDTGGLFEQYSQSAQMGYQVPWSRRQLMEVVRLLQEAME